MAARRLLMRCVRLSFQQLMQTEALIRLSDVAWSGTNSRLPQRGWANCPQLWQVNGEENRVNVMSQGPQRLPMCLMVIVNGSVSIRGKPGWSQLGGRGCNFKVGERLEGRLLSDSWPRDLVLTAFRRRFLGGGVWALQMPEEVFLHVDSST